MTEATLRRLAWRAGRRLYCIARGEVPNDIACNGEAYVQSCVLRSTASCSDRLMVFDIGANVGDWTGSFLSLLPDDRVRATRLMAFEPVPSTRARFESELSRMPHAEIVEVFPLALSSSPGSTRMAVFSESGGTNSLEFEASETATHDIITVEKITLTEFCSAHDLDRVHLL